MVFRISLPRLVSLWNQYSFGNQIHGIRGRTKLKSNKDYENKKYNGFKKKRNIPKRYCFHNFINQRDEVFCIITSLYGIAKLVSIYVFKITYRENGQRQLILVIITWNLKFGSRCPYDPDFFSMELYRIFYAIRVYQIVKALLTIKLIEIITSPRNNHRTGGTTKMKRIQ